MNPTFSAHYISGTHWDREWYRPFQEFRVLLVRLLDDLLDIIERDPEFKHFQLDGKTCILDDYLEIRPENRARLEAFIQNGRILIGPWFTMPDLFCVGDEALVRNLLMGKRICREWGAPPMPIGFVCDMFGHPSQMAQIFGGFAIHDFVLRRGTNESATPMYFNWQSPDGSSAFTFKLQDAERYGAFAKPRATLEELHFFMAMPEFRGELTAASSDEARLAVREKMASYRVGEICQPRDSARQRRCGLPDGFDGPHFARDRSAALLVPHRRSRDPCRAAALEPARVLCRRPKNRARRANAVFPL